MANNTGLKLFLSFSHADNEMHKTNFITHISPLITNGLLKEWHDRKVPAGGEIQDSIDCNLETADIVCLLVSANFLASPECLKEKKRAFELRAEKGILVVPIILSPCGWKDDIEISKVRAFPTDAKPISSFSEPDEAWNNVYNGLKSAIEEENKVKGLTVKDSFLEFLNNAELLTKAHSRKVEVRLEDIFVYPELKQFDDLKVNEKKIKSEILINDFIKYSKILIAGEDQSGKTTLCKKMYVELRNKNFVPIYISDKTNQYKGLICNKIEKAYKEQYQESVLLEEIDKRRIVLLVDDFHFAIKKEKHIRDLAPYCHQVVIVDDIFSLNFKDEALIKSFSQFKIKQFSPSLRNSLIEKWVHLSDALPAVNGRENAIYKDIDAVSELVDSTLGKIFSSGIMPAYPFFILSIISTYETLEKPLDQEITSQGYCYQALIYLYLRKQGVKNDEIDIYVNFLTEFAFQFYSERKQELSTQEFDSFMLTYLAKFNFPIKKEILLQKLQNTKIIRVDNFNNYAFIYPYLYYFFVAKYDLPPKKWTQRRVGDSINTSSKTGGVQWQGKTAKRSALTGSSRSQRSRWSQRVAIRLRKWQEVWGSIPLSFTAGSTSSATRAIRPFQAKVI